MRNVSIILILSSLMFACRPAKKIQQIQEPVVIVDTTVVMIPPVTDNPKNGKNEKKDSVLASADIFKKVVKNIIFFKTFSAKVRVQYENNDESDEATAYVRIKKDSLVWISLRGPLGIEGFRVLINKDSVKVMNLLKKNVQYRSIHYLQEITGIPFDFSSLEDLIIGNPIFIDSNVVSYQINSNNQLSVLMAGNIFKHLISLDNSDYRLLHSKLSDINASRNRTTDITFDDYDNSSGILFSTKRKMSVTEQSILHVNLDFKQYAFNQAITFPFNVPKNYKKLN